MMSRHLTRRREHDSAEPANLLLKRGRDLGAYINERAAERIDLHVGRTGRDILTSRLAAAAIDFVEKL